jgi:hypothetical protein
MARSWKAALGMLTVEMLATSHRESAVRYEMAAQG